MVQPCLYHPYAAGDGKGFRIVIHTAGLLTDENLIFGAINQLAVIVPGDYEKEAQALKALAAMEEVDSCMGLANIEAIDGYILTQQLSPQGVRRTDRYVPFYLRPEGEREHHIGG